MRRLTVADIRGVLKRLPATGLQVLRYKSKQSSLEQMLDMRELSKRMKKSSKAAS